MDEQLTNKVTLVGWLLLAGYAAYAVASGIAALTLPDDFGEIGKRDRLYQLIELPRPHYVLLALGAALVGMLVHRLGRGAAAERQALLLINVAKVAAALAVLLGVGLAISFATDDRDGVPQWGELAKALSGIPLAAAVFIVPVGRTTSAAGTPAYTGPAATTTGPQPTQAPPTAQQPTTSAPPPPPPGAPPTGV